MINGSLNKFKNFLEINEPKNIKTCRIHQKQYQEGSLEYYMLTLRKMFQIKKIMKYLENLEKQEQNKLQITR